MKLTVPSHRLIYTTKNGPEKNKDPKKEDKDDGPSIRPGEGGKGGKGGGMDK